SGADDREPFDAAPGELRQHLVGVGFDPGSAPQPRLKGNAELLRGEAQPLRQGARGLERLRAVTADILFDEPFTAVRRRKAIAAAGIAFPHLALRQPVEA